MWQGLRLEAHSPFSRMAVVLAWEGWARTVVSISQGMKKKEKVSDPEKTEHARLSLQQMKERTGPESFPVFWMTWLGGWCQTAGGLETKWVHTLGSWVPSCRGCWLSGTWAQKDGLEGRQERHQCRDGDPSQDSEREPTKCRGSAAESWGKLGQKSGWPAAYKRCRDSGVWKKSLEGMTWYTGGKQDMNSPTKTKGAAVYRKKVSNISCCRDMPDGEGWTGLGSGSIGESELHTRFHPQKECFIFCDWHDSLTDVSNSWFFFFTNAHRAFNVTQASNAAGRLQAHMLTLRSHMSTWMWHSISEQQEKTWTKWKKELQLSIWYSEFKNSPNLIRNQ